MSDSDLSSGQMWEDYLFLTREMGKFLLKGDLDMFSTLLGQRDKLQSLLNSSDTGGYRTSSAGQTLLRVIERENAVIARELRRRQNGAKKREQLSSAYDILGPKLVGKRMDQRG